jgi:DNA-binding NarL/FixJ family response regulator
MSAQKQKLKTRPGGDSHTSSPNPRHQTGSTRTPQQTVKHGVVIVDDHEIAREGIRSRIDMEPDLAVVSALSSADDLVRVCERHRPALVLMDIDMPGADPFTMISELRRLMPQIRVVLLSAYLRDGYLDAAVQSGAWGYLSKSESFDEILRGVRQVLAGDLAFAPEVLERFEFVNGHFRRRSNESANPISLLTPRELEVMRLIAKGLSTKEIAGVLHRSPKTIDAHRTSLMRKLDIDDRVDLTRYAIREGLVEP